jgi:TPR repeat protein
MSFSIFRPIFRIKRPLLRLGAAGVAALLFAALAPLHALAADRAQVARAHPGCTGGGKEAEDLFNLGRNYSKGMNGMPFDREKAVRCYKESLELGNPKAAINLGIFIRMAWVLEPGEDERLQLMNSYFQKAIDMGCPDAYYHLAYSYQNGWGVPKDMAKVRELMKKGADADSCACMAGVGMILDHDKKPEEAKLWLQRALDGGHGAAAVHLRRIYFREKNVKKQINVLRHGAYWGDIKSLIGLYAIYSDGYDQPEDMEYANCFLKLAETIDENIEPPIIDNLDELCPLRPVIPYTRPGREE